MGMAEKSNGVLQYLEGRYVLNCTVCLLSPKCSVDFQGPGGLQDNLVDLQLCGRRAGQQGRCTALGAAHVCSL